METLRSGIGKGAFIAAMIASQVLPAFALRLLFFHRVCLEDTAAILFSSGSEGSPKGVMLTHENIMGNIKQVASLFNARDHDVFLGTLPLFHAFGLTVTHSCRWLKAYPWSATPIPRTPTGSDALPPNIRRRSSAPPRHFLASTPAIRNCTVSCSPLCVWLSPVRRGSATRHAGPSRKSSGWRFTKATAPRRTTPVASVNTVDVLNTNGFSVQVGSKPGTVGLPLPGKRLARGGSGDT